MNKTLQSMSLDEKIGQLFFYSIRAYDCEEGSLGFEEIKDIIKKYNIGGLLVFYGDAYKTATLLKDLQSVSKFPLLVASDIERGAGQLFAGGTEFPTNMAIAATKDSSLAYSIGRLVALEARAMGINIAYSPVCDINTNADNPIINTRSFGDDPRLVSLFSSEYIRGLQEGGGILAVAKHFPGHGNVSLDSHSDLPSLNISKELLYSRELIPFKSAIDANVSQIMTAHISLPLITGKDNLPATLSPLIIEGLLRKELKFNGLVVSDALNMGGITKHFSPSEAVVLALKAGVDVLLYPEDLPSLISAIKSAINNGDLSIERINTAVLRILALKEQLSLFNKRSPDISLLHSVLNSEKTRELAYKTALSSLTLINPLDNENSIRLSFEKIQCIIFDEDGDANLFFVEELENRIGNLKVFAISGKNNSKEKEDYSANIIDKSFINNCPTIILIYSKIKAWKDKCGLSPSLLNILNMYLEAFNKLSNKEIIIISFASPYIYNSLNKSLAFKFIATYSHNYYSQLACLDALANGIEFKGSLPIDL